MIRKEKNGVVWLEFEILQGLNHAVFLRHGGYSAHPFDSLNLSHHCGDDKKAVSKNWEKVMQIMNLDQMKACRQTHGKNIVEATTDNILEYDNSDALTTSTPGLGLLIRHADCQAAIFYDPVNKAIANVHAGWKGNVLNIYQETVSFMNQKYGTEPKDLLVGISPSLGPNASEFKNYLEEFPKSFWLFQEKPNYFNLWKIARKQLTDAGVKNIEIAEICTYTEEKDCFSYRRENITGRLGTVVAL